jgi:hypothetical protein
MKVSGTTGNAPSPKERSRSERLLLLVIEPYGLNVASLYATVTNTAI